MVLLRAVNGEATFLSTSFPYNDASNNNWPTQADTFSSMAMVLNIEQPDNEGHSRGLVLSLPIRSNNPRSPYRLSEMMRGRIVVTMGMVIAIHPPRIVKCKSF